MTDITDAAPAAAEPIPVTEPVVAAIEPEAAPVAEAPEAAEPDPAPRLRVTIKGHLQIHTGHMVGGIEQVFQADEEFEIADAEAVRELLERGLATKA